MQEPAPRRPTGQEAQINGRNNIIVQIVGDGNTVVSGYAHLTLTRYLTRRRIEGDTDLLSPYTRSIPLIGREREMADLRAWLEGDRPISVRVLTGRAGSGKTRLALELCEAMLADGWDAGFIDSGELLRFRNQQNLSTWGWRRPTLAVIDYVAAQAELLSGWLQELADNPGDPAKPLRLLLLERQADTGSGWWQTAFGRGGWGARAVRKLLNPAEPTLLAPLAASSERREVLSQVLREKGAEIRPPKEGTDPVFDRKLKVVPWSGEPLFLMMAGVLASDRSMGELLALRRTDLAFELAERELDRVGRFAGKNDNRRAVLCHLAAYTTLCRGLSREAAETVAEVEKQELKRPAAGDAAELVDLLEQALPGPSRIEPILPDMIGEAAILRTFAPLCERSALVVCRAFALAGQPVAATVVRTAQDFAGGGHAAPLAWFDALVERDEVSLDQLMLLADTLPKTSFALLQHAVRLTLMVANCLRDAEARGEAHRLPLLAAALNNLGLRLGAVGRRSDALAPAKEAVEIYRAPGRRGPGRLPARSRQVPHQPGQCLRRDRAAQ